MKSIIKYSRFKLKEELLSKNEDEKRKLNNLVKSEFELSEKTFNQEETINSNEFEKENIVCKYKENVKKILCILFCSWDCFFHQKISNFQVTILF